MRSDKIFERIRHAEERALARVSKHGLRYAGTLFGLRRWASAMRFASSWGVDTAA